MNYWICCTCRAVCPALADWEAHTSRTGHRHRTIETRGRERP